MATPATSSSYTFQPSSVPEEIQRLDSLHRGLTDLFGGRLSFCPLEGTQPKSIIELGSGSGAWAIQAATTFPDAEVLAVDKSPLPDRPLPRNLQYRELDLTSDPLPLPQAHYDIVHARLVIMHLPDGASVLRRACELVKPGGWLLIEDPDDADMRSRGELLTPHEARFVSLWHKVLESRGAQPGIGRDLESIIRSTGLFKEVNARKVSIPYTGGTDDPARNKLGAVWLENAHYVAEHFTQRFAEHGFTPEISAAHIAMLDSPEKDITTEMYFVWAQRTE